MSTEWGLFNDEGCVDRGFYSEAQALTALQEADPEDDLRALELCPEHEEQPKDGCEGCAAEEEEEEEGS